MKFLMTYEPTVKEPPTPEKMAKLGKFAQESAQAGILVMTGGLQRPSKGTRVKMSAGNFTVDGPYAETKELIDGFVIVEVKSLEEALDVARRFMTVAGDGHGEVLAVYEQGGRS
ncbi:MAG TPA: YciI family protein [Polyangiaceae bacterium]|nr:YciI family protein [Polyangiaceae bacterium]